MTEQHTTPHDFMPGCGHYPEAIRAYELQEQMARNRGDIWTDKQQAVMRELHQCYVLTGRGETLSRKAWPLAVGTGKSQSICALMKAQAELKQAGKAALSILVCVERNEQMLELHKSALEYGVPAEYVAVHSSEHPCEDTDSVLFLFVTHARMLRGKQRIDDVNSYQGTERSLIIWDESLFASRPVTLDLNELDVAVYRLRVEGARNDDALAAADYLSGYLAALKSQPTYQAELSAENETRYRAGVNSLTQRKHQQERQLLEKAIECSTRPARMIEYVDGATRRAAAMYDVLIPDTIKRLVILDASHTIRLLCSRHDKLVTTVNMDCRVKTFDKVQVKQIKQGAGRGPLDKELAKGMSSPLTRRLVDEVSRYPEGEAVLVITLKQDALIRGRGKVSHQELFKDAMKEHGLDVDQQLNGVRRFEFTTWGAHVGVNSYKHCRHVVCVGVLRRNMGELQSQVIANERDLNSKAVTNTETMREIELSEAFHNLMQAAGRGTCRNTVAGEASPMTLFFAFSDKFPQSWWDSSMPGVVPDIEEGRTGKAQEAVQAVLKVLAGLPERQQKVSFQTLRNLAGLLGLHANTYGRVLKEAREACHGWEQVGRAFKRVSPFDPVA